VFPGGTTNERKEITPIELIKSRGISQ